MSNFIYSSHNPNYATPKAVYEELDREFHFNCDPCPLNEKPSFDGLNTEWGSSTFINPPYTGVTKWIERAILESQNYGKTIVMLLRGDTSTKWFHDLVIPNAFEVRFIKGRLCFNDSKPAPFPSIIVVFKNVNENDIMRAGKARDIHGTVSKTVSDSLIGLNAPVSLNGSDVHNTAIQDNDESQQVGINKE